MTQNQIAFAKLKEEQRHNQVLEGQGYESLAESRRHNTANENIGWYTGASTVALNEARASYQNLQSDNFYLDLIANSKYPKELALYLVAKGFVDKGLPFIQDILNDRENGGLSGGDGKDMYSNPNYLVK